MMLLRDSKERILKKLFPVHMKLRDKKRINKEKLKRIQANVHLTREQWIEKIQEQYEDRIGHALDLDNPKRFTEKIQWRKLNDNNPLYSTLSDKYAVREWVKEKIGEEYLIPLLGVWDKAKEIDFDKLPNSFVLKPNNAAGRNIIVRDKKEINEKLIIEQMDFLLEYPFWARWGEFHYRSIQPKIIAEEFMQYEGADDIPDYKFLCFHGKPYCCSVDVNRFHGHKRITYDLDWNPQNWTIKGRDFDVYSGSLEKPAQFDKMISLVEKLCEGFSFVRADLYLIKNNIYFGEMTFTPGAGYTPVVPDEYDYILGEQWIED